MSRRPSACTRPKPDSKSKPSAWPSHHAAVAEMQPDGLGLGDEIADGQHQPVVDQHAVAGALGAERFRAEGIGGDDRMQPDHRGQRAVEVETVIARARLVRGRHFPFGQRGHGGLLANRGASGEAVREIQYNLCRERRSLKSRVTIYAPMISGFRVAPASGIFAGQACSASPQSAFAGARAGIIRNARFSFSQAARSSRNKVRRTLPESSRRPTLTTSKLSGCL